MDFFSMILESLYEILIQKFGFINNSVIRCIAQVMVMILASAVIICIVFFVSYVIKKFKQ